MVGQIGPLVQVGKRRTALALHVAGGIAGGVTIGLLLGFLGLLLRAALGDGLDTAFVVVVPLVLAYMALTDLGLLRLTYLTTIRQTPGSWPCSLGHYPGIFAWGFDLGLGVSTRIPHQSLLVLPVAAVLVGNLPAAIAITGAYGAARSLAVIAAISGAGEDYPGVCDVIQSKVGVLKRLVGATALAMAALIVIF
jgi:hypothetical protein